MGVLLIAKIDPLEDFDVSFLKETIQWYRSGALYNVIRLFVRPRSKTFSGFYLMTESRLQSVEDRSSVLMSSDLMGMLKERQFKVLADGTFLFDEQHYYVTPVVPEFTNVGRFSVIDVTLPKPLDVFAGAPLLAFLVVARAEDRHFSSFALAFFGSIEMETHLLMPPSTVTVETTPIPLGEGDRVRLLEGNAVRVERYEIWIVAEGHIEATSVDSTHTPKRNRGFVGQSVLEKHYSLPRLTRGWELAIDYRNGSVWFNEAVRCSFKHQKFFLVLAWIFGVATVLGLVLTILALL